MKVHGSSMGLNPDLIFGELAVGDVKYKIANDWVRADLNQAVTFAVGFGKQKAAIISFSSDARMPESVTIGDVEVTHFRGMPEPELRSRSASNSVMMAAVSMGASVREVGTAGQVYTETPG